MWFRLISRRLCIFLITLIFVGFAGATLVRLAPGFGSDARELDSRLRPESIQSIRDAREGERDLFRFYRGYVAGLLRGNLGYSHTLGRPISELFAERAPTTLATVAAGLAGGWLLGLIGAVAVAISRSRWIDLFMAGTSGLFLCLPSAVLALLFLFTGGPAKLAVAFAVFPKIFQYTRNLLVESYGRPHILGARARGLRASRIFWWHVVPSAAPQILALAGVSVSIAFAASIPIEVICDLPGMGQLAWQAALARDMPLLVSLTLVVTALTLIANSASDLAIAAGEKR